MCVTYKSCDTYKIKNNQIIVEILYLFSKIYDRNERQSTKVLLSTRLRTYIASILQLRSICYTDHPVLEFLHSFLYSSAYCEAFDIS